MTLIEIDKQIEETRNKLFDLREQRSKILAGEYDLRGKYIYHEYYGYMYVLEQYNPRYHENVIVLQGLEFRANPGVHSEDCFFSLNALGIWEIPVQSYQDYMQKKMFKEITKEEFYTKLKNSLKEISITSEKVFKELTDE